MKFTFLTYGTEGDSRPMVALAHGLIAKGHEVRLLADVSAAELAQAHGVPFTALAGNMKETVLPGGALSGIMKDGGDLARITRALADVAKQNTPAWVATTAEAAKGTDLLVFSGLAAYVGLAVAEELGVANVGAGVWPLTPTREFPSAFVRPGSLPSWANTLSHRFFGALSWHLFRGAVDQGMRRVFGKPVRRKMWQGYRVLYGFSPSLVPRPADWLPYVEICGAWHLPAPRWTPPAALEEFIARGEAPIYVGFGSMAGFDRARLLRAIVDAIAGRRAILYPGWSGIDTSALPANFHVIDNTPHDWLFPRMSLAIHHGGAGTTHAAARSGVPSVVVPFAGDQFFWGDRIAKAGIGAACAHSSKMDGAALGRLVADASRDEMRRNARAMAEAMRLEDGNAVAEARLVEWARNGPFAVKSG